MPIRTSSVHDPSTGVATIDVSGADVSEDLFPWMASIQQQVDTRISPECGGTLIARRWVLTAGHCGVSPPSAAEPDRSWRVVIGRRRLLDLDGGVFGVSRALRPLGFRGNPFYEDDLCLIELDRDADGFTPVSLIDPAEAKLASGTDLLILGWGNQGIDGVTLTLRQGQARLTALNDCRDEYQARFPDKVFGSEMLCAGSSGQGACERDSGGPLLLESGGVLKQAGVINFSPDCGRPSGLGVHTRVADYLDWIRQHVPGI